MNREDIIRMAREANWYASQQTGDSHEWQNIRDERFAAMVAAAERERILDILERLQERAGDSHNYYGYAAQSIRARGQA
jgi:hypothetical protein